MNKGNYQTKWRQIPGYREQLSGGRGLGIGEEGEGIKQRNKRKTHGHRQPFGDCQGEEGKG